MNPDIVSREDLFIIVRDFYVELLQSEDLSHFFEAFRNQELLDEHLKILVDFWDNTLFYSGTYKKNAIKPHLTIHREKEIQSAHFDQWINLFNKAVDQNFKGQNADIIKSRALSIATVMKLKLKLI